MCEIRRIRRAPANLGDYIEEILPPYEKLYGPLAAQHYRLNAPRDLALTMAHPALRCYAVMDGSHARALLFVRTTATRYLLSFFHELQGNPGNSQAGDLLRFVVNDLEQSANPLIQSEYLSFSPATLEDAYVALGFQRIDRSVQRCPLPTAPALSPAVARIAPLEASHQHRAAHVLPDAYTRHPEKMLFEEVTDSSAAATYLAQLQAGGLGASRPAYQLGAWMGDTCVGVVLGSEVVAGLGFVLHMAVVPSSQGQGIGRHLLAQLTGAFQQAGLHHAALAVTNSNPARYLYEQIGFETVQAFPVYYRLPKK